MKHITLISIVTMLLFSSCDTMNEESRYNTTSWEIKRKRLELEYLKELHEYRRDLEIQQKIAQIDSILQSDLYNTNK